MSQMTTQNHIYYGKDFCIWLGTLFASWVAVFDKLLGDLRLSWIFFVIEFVLIALYPSIIISDYDSAFSTSNSF